MHWFTAPDGTRFLVQTPLECAESLAKAFPDSGVPVTAKRFMAQVKKECPVPKTSADRPSSEPGK